MRSSNLPSYSDAAGNTSTGASMLTAADHKRSKSADIRTRQRLVLSDDSVSESSICGLEGICLRRRSKHTVGDSRLACDFDKKIPPAASIPAKQLRSNPREVRRSEYAEDFLPFKYDTGACVLPNVKVTHDADFGRSYNTVGRMGMEPGGGMQKVAESSWKNPNGYCVVASVADRVYTQGKHSSQSASQIRALGRESTGELYEAGAISPESTSTDRYGGFSVGCDLHGESTYTSRAGCESASEESESEEYDSWEIYGNDNEGVRYEGAFNSSKLTPESDAASPGSECESSPFRSDQEKGVDDANYESQSSLSCSSCCEECNNINNNYVCKSYNKGDDETELDPTDPHAGDDSYSEELSSATSSDSESSPGTGSSRKHESIKRSSRALDDEPEDNYSLRYGAYSIKRFRSSEGLAVLPPVVADCYQSDSSLSADSPLAASSCVTKHIPSHDEHSPAPGQEAGTGSCGADKPGSSLEATHREMVGADIQWRKYEGAIARSTLGGTGLGVCGAFRHRDNPLPFQLHPAHHDDLEEYFYFMREREVVSHPSYCLQGQQKIKSTMRRILVEWLTMIAHHYKLNGETIHLTVNILDRYTERQQGIYRGHYQLLGVTSLLVASKQLEVDIPPVSTCLMLCRNLYSKAQMLSLERHLLDILYFDLNVPTAHTFLDYYVIRAYHDDTASNLCRYHPDDCRDLKKILCVARRLLDTGLADYEFSQYLPSIAAKAAMELAQAIVTEPDSPRPFHRVLQEVASSRYLPGTDGCAYGDEAQCPSWRRPDTRTSCELPQSHYDFRYSPHVPRKLNCPTAVRFYNSCQRSASSILTDGDPDEVQESILALTVLVGEREIRTIQLMLNKVVAKYSFE